MSKVDRLAGICMFTRAAVLCVWVGQGYGIGAHNG